MMEETKNEITIEEAREIYMEYLEAGLAMFPPVKGYGMKLIEFAVERPEAFKRFFNQPDLHYTYEEFLLQEMRADKILPYAMSSLEVNRQDALWLLTKLGPYACGIGQMIASGCRFSKDEIAEGLGSVMRGLMLSMKSPADERIRIHPTNEEIEMGDLSEYMKGRKNMIIGYGPNKEIYQVRLDAILYFEAVGEHVFAYTKNNIYEIHQRLYAIASAVEAFEYIRISKSLLVNTKKITSMAPHEGGRGKVNMINGETVIASRAYMKNLMNFMKQ